jgi:RNA 3'-terminal phosphate cyclase (ATP)
MIEIDGSHYSGSGTILRHAVALATLLGEPLHMTNIRARRDKPGLRPQHLQAAKACCELSGGRLEGGEVNSREIRYTPGGDLKGGQRFWDIGTAGSATMLALAVIPVSLFSDAPSRFMITGGLFQDFAPSALHMQKVLIPLLARMGASVRMDILRPGYVPKGLGKLKIEVEPLRSPLSPLRLPHQGSLKALRGISLASHLESGDVGRRMADESRRLFRKEGMEADIEIVNDASAVQKGAALLLWAETESDALLGADQAGKIGRKSEHIARFVAGSLLKDLRSGATTDRHSADQLIIFAALARGCTQYLIPEVTDHVSTNLWLVNEWLGADARLQDHRLTIEGRGLTPPGG